MSNIRYYNQTGPFWDFIASLEGTDFNNHPFFRQFTGGNDAETTTNDKEKEKEKNISTEEGEQAAAGPSEKVDQNITSEEEHDENHDDEWTPFMAGFPFGGRGRHGRGRGGWGGPPRGFWGGPHGGWGASMPHRGPPGPPPPGMDMHMPPPGDAEMREGGEEPKVPGDDTDEKHGHGHGHHRRHGPGARRERGGPCGGVRGRGGRRGGPWGGPWNVNNIAEYFQNYFGDNARGAGVDSTGTANANGDFTPPVDVFDTESSFIVDVSVPGAKKTDIAVAWDAEKSELSISGVVHRSGDEAFLKNLALDERKIGAFARKVRLGSRANPAQVDAEGITAKLEDGILRITVPKEEKDFEVVHKVDVN